MLFKIKLTGMKTSRLVAEDPCSERSEVTRVEGGQRKESVKSTIEKNKISSLKLSQGRDFIYDKTFITFLTDSTDLSKAAFSLSVKSSSITFSTPFPPKMTGTPKYKSEYPYSPSI